MTVQELAALAQKMRAAQKRFFERRDNLEEAMMLEREVDAALDRLAGAPALFDLTEEGHP